VISGPVAALLVATQMSSIGDRLDSLSATAGIEVPPDTSGAEGFAELFIAAYLGAGEDSIRSWTALPLMELKPGRGRRPGRRASEPGRSPPATMP
jgi:hypothetical protein